MRVNMSVHIVGVLGVHLLLFLILGARRGTDSSCVRDSSMGVSARGCPHASPSSPHLDRDLPIQSEVKPRPEQGSAGPGQA